MPKRLLACLCSLLILAALSFVPDEADAARIGGGRSFGGRPSMSTPYNKPMTSPSSPTMRQQANQAGPAAAAAAPGRGLFGGMGGLFGGLLAGGLIGSLLFGGGMGAGGMGGLLDIVLIAALLYFGFKFFARRRAASQAAGPDGAAVGAFDYRGGERTAPTMQREAAPASGKGGFDWGALTSSSAPAASGMFNGEPTDVNGGIHLPGGFDQEEFLNGAKAAYARLNTAWDRRDIDDIAQFATPAFLEEIRKQKEEDPTPGKTEIMLMNSASVLEGKVEDGEQIVSVYFDVLLREDPSQETPVNVREVWHFTRPADGNGSWKLDGIQQVERA